MGQAFVALGFRNYRLFFIGQTISLVGSWMETMAMSWLVYRLTGSEIMLGTVAFCSQIPAFAISPFAGLVADKFSRKTILIITQSAAAVVSFVLAGLVLSGLIQPWHIMVTSVLLGVINAYDMPTRQAFVPDILEDKSALPNAIAMNSTQFNIARMIGPVVAGITVAAVGEGYCFLINGISFAFVIGAILMMRLQPWQANPSTESPMQRLRSGASYAWEHKPIRALLQLMATTSLVSGAYAVLLPVFTKDVFHGDSRTLGYLSAAIAVGALGAAMHLAARKTVVGIGNWILFASFVFNLGLLAFAPTATMWAALPVLAIMGYGGMKHMGATNTLIQTLVDDNMRGRVMSFYMMSFVGTMPIGSFLSGLLAGLIGPHWTLAIASVVGFSGTLVFYLQLPKLRKIVRPIYEEMGLLQPLG